MPEQAGQWIRKRDLLKRRAALGGAVVWVRPLVQTVGMGRAFAQMTSLEDAAGSGGYDGEDDGDDGDEND